MADEDVELPKAIVKRIVKAKLAESITDGSDKGKEFQVSKDALTAFSQATKVFISYVTTAAHDICKENQRSTVAPQDIMQALKELDFESFIPGLEDVISGESTRSSSVSLSALHCSRPWAVLVTSNSNGRKVRHEHRVSCCRHAIEEASGQERHQRRNTARSN